MKSYILLLIFAIFSVLSCTDSDDTSLPACEVNSPVQDLEWLEMEIDRRNANPNEDMKYCYIVQARHKGEDVFVYQDCNPLINKAIRFYNCEGAIINTTESPIVFDNLQNKVIIWKPNDFVCQVSF